MIEGFIELLRRQRDAVITLEARLDALEVVVAIGEHHLLGSVLEEVESASDVVASLELARSLVTSAAGLPPDVSGRDMVERCGAPDEARLSTVVEELRCATEQLGSAKRRVEVVVRSAAASLRSRSAGGSERASV